jgi:hypothetical protein
VGASAPGAPGAVAERGSRVELADIVRAHGAAYQQAHVLSRAQRRALRAIAACRTAALGGHRAVCDTCGAERITYNSCRNRHCPKCQRLATQRWLDARRRELLPIEYFHAVFTLLHALNPLAQSHPQLIYRLLFQAAATTLQRFGRDPHHLGGDLGVTAILGPDWMAVARGRSGPVVRNLIGPQQQCKALEDIAHFARSQNADAVNEPRAIDGSDLGDVYDTRTRKSCFTSPEAHVARHGSKPEV